MRNFLLTAFLLLSTTWCLGNTFYHLEFKADYSYTNQQDSFVRIALVMESGSISRSDTFDFTKSATLRRNYNFSDNFIFNRIYFVMFNRAGQEIRAFVAGKGYDTMRCDGYVIKKPFSGNSCVDLKNNALGILCAEIRFNYVRDHESDAIEIVNNSTKFPNQIYTISKGPDSASKMNLIAPCYFGYAAAKAAYNWFESRDGGTSWTWVGSGLQMCPIESRLAGKNYFNQNIWYKVVVDSNYIQAQWSGYSSPMIGPFLFFVGVSPDSVVLHRKSACNRKNSWVFYYSENAGITDSLTPKIWLKFWEMGTNNVVKYFLGTVGAKSTDILGHPVFQDSGCHSAPAVPFRSGMYQLFCDFTPWHAFDDLYMGDTVLLEDNDSTFFEITSEIKRDVKCFGISDGVVRLGADGTGRFVFSHLGSSVVDTVVIFENIAAGRQDFWVSSASGCKVSETIDMAIPEMFFHTFQDTVLCNKQKATYAAFHNNARTYNWKHGGKWISAGDSVQLHQAGTYTVTWTDFNSCKWVDTFEIKVNGNNVVHDFIIPSQAFLPDTVVAVAICNSRAESVSWHSDSSAVAWNANSDLSGNFRFSKSGMYEIQYKGIYEGCHLVARKRIEILSLSDSLRSNPKLGYRGAMIKSVKVYPNPSNGTQCNISMVLRDTGSVNIELLDAVNPVPGERRYFYGMKEILWNPAAIAPLEPGIYYVRIFCGSERKVLKMVVVGSMF